MRGKAVTASSNRSCRRITPAHAGKSEITEAAAAAGKDHPRPCGEKYNISPTVFALVGSPPPMRGKECPSLSASVLHRITPAHAGKRLFRINANMRSRDHPRPCGEKYIADAPLELWQGSPPPMRGKVAGYARTVEITGITPAHAGKSHVYLLYARAGRDHPRPCGEKFDHELQRTRLIGSPPPMRGKENGPKPRKYTHRITPAHAGKRAAVKGNSPLKQDHPRPCGEKGGTAMAKYTATGSPPPMRGKARVGKTARYTSRITPAHAGKRGARLKSRAPARDHPRPCGEKRRSIKKEQGSTGSPPPMRGKD